MDDDPIDLKVDGGRFDLEGFVRNGTWREMLTELVDSRKLDPWDIDITNIVDGYVGAVKRMKILELHIPANIILAASILLRMKSDTISFFEAPMQEEIVNGDDYVRVVPDTSGLVYKSRISPARRITLEELMDALEDAMKVEKERFQIRNTPVEMPIRIDQVGIDQKVERVVNMASKYADHDGSTTFGNLAREFPREIMLTDLFIPLLFLANRGELSMVQEAFFGEIIITLLGNRNG